ncbi:MAG: hypothetical protein KDK61_01055, partial [Simkania sp.]|nr:hypothetical protein [Simkania sp.]
AGNKGNVNGLAPFLPRYGEGQKVLNPDQRDQFLIRTLERLNFIKTDDEVVGGQHGSVIMHKRTLKPRGAAAFTDIKRAKHLQNIVIANIDQRVRCLPQRKIETNRDVISRVLGTQISCSLARPNAL